LLLSLSGLAGGVQGTIPSCRFFFWRVSQWHHAFLRNGSAQDEINFYFLFSAFAFGFQLFSLVCLINSSK
jgi:hypothetical protein